MKRTLVCAMCLILLSIFVVAQQTSTSVAIPTVFAWVNGMPFGNTLGSGIYQQVYAADRFPGKVRITGITFVPSDGSNLPGAVPGTYEITLSVTNKPICGLDGSDASNNITSQEHPFFRGSLDGGVAFSGAPFLYDPADGNLLMTIRIGDRVVGDTTRGGMFRGGDCQGTSRAWFFPDYPNPFNTDKVGLVTIFSFNPINSSGVKSQNVIFDARPANGRVTTLPGDQN